MQTKAEYSFDNIYKTSISQRPIMKSQHENNIPPQSIIENVQYHRSMRDVGSFLKVNFPVLQFARIIGSGEFGLDIDFNDSLIQEAFLYGNILNGKLFVDDNDNF